MTADERAALRALAEAATPGPWERGDWHIWSKADGVSREVCGMGGWEHRDDGAFIAAARAAVPALLDALDAAEAERDEARAVASELIDKLSVAHVRANEAARLSSDANGRAEDARRRWAAHQDVCVMASLDRETLETERDEARAALAEAQAEVEAARRVAWRIALSLKDVEPVEELPKGYDIEEAWARFSSRVGIERLNAANAAAERDRYRRQVEAVRALADTIDGEVDAASVVARGLLLIVVGRVGHRIRAALDGAES